MNKELKSLLQEKLSSKISVVSPISGGDVSETYRIHMNDKFFFIKISKLPQGLDMFEKEASGLELLKCSGSIKTPQILEVGTIDNTSFMIMEYVSPMNPSSIDMKHFGRQLCILHDRDTDFFGLETDNYIGNLIQVNTVSESWLSFFLHCRLQPQLELAVSKGLIAKEDQPDDDKIVSGLMDLFNDVKPSLLHGDLWSGNYLMSEERTFYLIDPAVYYGHSEVDIAMSLLFGGFGKPFYEGYFGDKGPDEKSKDRIEIYQLYYLLVHLNMFGSSYLSAVMKVIKKFFG